MENFIMLILFSNILYSFTIIVLSSWFWLLTSSVILTLPWNLKNIFNLNLFTTEQDIFWKFWKDPSSSSPDRYGCTSWIYLHSSYTRHSALFFFLREIRIQPDKNSYFYFTVCPSFIVQMTCITVMNASLNPFFLPEGNPIAFRYPRSTGYYYCQAAIKLVQASIPLPHVEKFQYHCKPFCFVPLYQLFLHMMLLFPRIQRIPILGQNWIIHIISWYTGKFLKRQLSFLCFTECKTMQHILWCTWRVQRCIFT